MYKCAIIGVGPNRSRGLAEAYQHITRGQLRAASARTRENLDAFADEFSIANRYLDYREMFESERPDLVHVNTPPSVRLEIMEAAQACGIAALIIEKPLAIAGEDYRAIRSFAEQSSVKIAINHQLHFQPRRFALQQRVTRGEIGEIRSVDASCGMNLAYQGTHVLESIGAFLPGKAPTQVLAQVCGGNGLQETPKKHFAPDNALAVLSYPGGIQAHLQSGITAPLVGRDGINTHKRIAVYGTRGFAHWTMWSWEIGIDGRIETGTHEYAEEDILGQARMTEAMMDWLADDAQVHPLNLQNALVDFNTLLGMYTSTLERKAIDLPSDPADRLIDRLRQTLIAEPRA